MNYVLEVGSNEIPERLMNLLVSMTSFICPDNRLMIDFKNVDSVLMLAQVAEQCGFSLAVKGNRFVLESVSPAETVHFEPVV